jgi:TonB family protein
VTNVRIIRPIGFGLDNEAVEAVRRWKFEPGKKAAEPVAVLATVEVNFRLL